MVGAGDKLDTKLRIAGALQRRSIGLGALYRIDLRIALTKEGQHRDRRSLDHADRVPVVLAGQIVGVPVVLRCDVDVEAQVRDGGEGG